jgi:hypothetical protein
LDPDPTFHPDADPDSRFQIKAYSLEKVLKYAHIPYILACHLQIDADPDPDQAYPYEADPDPDFYLMRMRILVPKMMRILVPKMMRIHADPDPDPTIF